MPDKYGQKYWLAVDKNIKNVVNRFSYVGRDKSHSRDERVSDQVVMRLSKPYLNKWLNVAFIDNYFTSVKLATELQKYKKSLEGTVNKIRKKVPSVLKHMKTPFHSTTLYKSNDVTTNVHQGKAKKNIIILSILHQNITIADNAKKTTRKCQTLQ